MRDLQPDNKLKVNSVPLHDHASLPRSLTDQLIVRTKVEADEEVLAARQALVESKSPVELSEIHSLAELPIPSRIEAWLSGNKVQENGER